MKNFYYLLVMTACIPLLAGCADTPTKVGEGAGIGGVLGAVAGGIIGHQTHDTAAGALIGGVVGAAGGAAIGSQIPKDNPYPYGPPVPTQVVVAQPAVIAPPATEDAFTVSVPNNNGSFTVVTIKRSGSGFTGPQGEFYPEFPKMSQLKAMYGK